jgi:hypothetical protein
MRMPSALASPGGKHALESATSAMSCFAGITSPTRFEIDRAITLARCCSPSQIENATDRGRTER